jgi:serine/threonine-protein kinase
LGTAAAVCALAVGLLAGRPALAQSADDKAAAEALFDEGKRLFLANKFAEACPKLESSQKLDPGIGTLLYLADCYEGMGRVASAWATFREATSQAKAAGQGERERVARARAAKLEARLHKLTIAVGAPDVPGLEVKRNDVAVKKEVWGSGLPVDPGTYRITASAPGKKAWTGSVTVPEGAGAQTLTVPPLEDAPAAPLKPTEPVKPAEPVKAPEPPPPPPPSGLGTQRIAGIAVGVGGVVALGVAGAMAGLAAGKNSTAKTLCPAVDCADPDGVDASHQAGTFADAATGLLVAGGVLAAGGLVLILTAPKKTAGPPEKAWIAPLVGRGIAGFSLGRTW